MSINTLSNDRGGIAHLNTRPTFLRDEGLPTLINTLDRYENLAGRSTTMNGAADGPLFSGGESKTDYKALAQAMLSRLDALRERLFGGASHDGQLRNDVDGPNTDRGDWKANHHGWWSGSNWYSTAKSQSESGGTPESPVAPPPSAPVGGNSTPTTTPVVTPAAPIVATNTPANATPTPRVQPPVTIGNAASSDSISLNDGATTIANTTITGSTGIVGDNATHVTTLNVENVVIQSTNYGIYLGACDILNLTNVNITCDPSGGDSYSVRGNIRNLVTTNSTFNSGIKAFRIYGLEGGSSTNDTYTGDRLMLGGGYANEWGDAGSFQNFSFSQGRINVNSVELYDNTTDVVFENMDFDGTGHISIQSGARNITFRNCTNLPPIRLYDGNGNWTPLPADASRNIVVVNE